MTFVIVYVMSITWRGSIGGKSHKRRWEIYIKKKWYATLTSLLFTFSLRWSVRVSGSDVQTENTALRIGGFPHDSFPYSTLAEWSAWGNYLNYFLNFSSRQNISLRLWIPWAPEKKKRPATGAWFDFNIIWLQILRMSEIKVQGLLGFLPGSLLHVCR